MDLFYLCVVGSMHALSVWKNKNFRVDFIETIHELKAGQCYDYVLMATPVSWLSDGTFDENELREHVRMAHEQGYFQEVVLISTLPIGMAEKLGCHYMPIQQYFLENTPMLFGCNEKVLVDYQSLHHFLFLLFEKRRVSLYFTGSVEMIFLITLCQNYINQSFYKEMSHFCFKNKIHIDFHNMSWILYQDMTPILVYMIQQMEDAKLDCPILYSCLFRQHYIDTLVP